MKIVLMMLSLFSGSAWAVIDGHKYPFDDVESAARFEQLSSDTSYEDEVITIGHIRTTRGELLKNIEEVEVEHNEAEPGLLNHQVFKSVINISLAATVAHTILQAPDDKKKHALAGLLIGAGVTRICKKVFMKGQDSMTCALSGAGAALLAGVLKEVYDGHGHGHVDAYDAIYTVIPGALISFKF